MELAFCNDFDSCKDENLQFDTVQNDCDESVFYFMR
jgi:hypothetical protein